MKTIETNYKELLEVYLAVKASKLSDKHKQLALGAIANLGNSFERNFDRDESFFIDKTIDIKG